MDFGIIVDGAVIVAKTFFANSPNTPHTSQISSGTAKRCER